MLFDWRPDKEALNIERRDISFGFAIQIWVGEVLDMPSPREHSTELRRIAFGLIDEKLYAVVYVLTNDNTTHHIISARRASRQEKRNYGRR